MNVSKVSQIGFISNYIKPQIKEKSLEEKIKNLDNVQREKLARVNDKL